MKELQNGMLMKIKDEQVWISARFGMSTADLPQGNDMAGLKDIMLNMDVALAKFRKVNYQMRTLIYFKIVNIII